MSANEKLLLAWKLCLSLTKRDWELADYPVVIREQKLEPNSELFGFGVKSFPSRSGPATLT
jgi:hypothetical protein